MNIVNPNAFEEEKVLMSKDPVLIYNNNQTVNIIKLDNLSGIFKKNSNNSILNSIKIKSENNNIDYKNKIQTVPSNQNYQVFHKNYNIINPKVKDYYKNELYNADLKWDFYTLGENARGGLDNISSNIELTDDHTGNNITDKFNLTSNHVNLAAVGGSNMSNYRYNNNLSGIGGNYFLYFELTSLNIPDASSHPTGENFGTLVYLASKNQTSGADCGMAICLVNNSIYLRTGPDYLSNYRGYGGNPNSFQTSFDTIANIKSIISAKGKCGIGLGVKSEGSKIILSLYCGGVKKGIDYDYSYSSANGDLTGIAFGACFDTYNPLASSSITNREVNIRNMMLFKDFNQVDLFSTLAVNDNLDNICLSRSNNPEKEVTIGFEDSPTSLNVTDISLNELDISNCKDLENLTVDASTGNMKYLDISQNLNLTQCKVNLPALEQLKLYSKVKNKSFILLFNSASQRTFGVYLGATASRFTPDTDLTTYYVSLDEDEYTDLCQLHSDLTFINL